ncbi:MAG: gamma-glutamyltransferase family protein [Rhodoferax sp.]|nr:gamma-glutamyltransferase family protein [Rhodoferax sp.]
MRSLCFALAAVIGTAWAQTPLVQPEGASGWSAKAGATHKTYAIAAANPLAADAGKQMLARGGSTIDAAIAAQMVLTLVEPQSSGLGGGAFLLHFDGKTTQAFDGRETAPAGVNEDLFLDAQGKPVSRVMTVVGGRSVGVPGVLRMLHLAHQQHGRLPWADLFAPAIALARDGFVVSPRMAKLLSGETQLRNDADAAAYFYDDKGQPRPAGYLLRNPELAAVLQLIAKQGPDAMMTGTVAQAMVRKVQGHTNPGSLSTDDLHGYQAKVREPSCFAHTVTNRSFRICGMGAPSSGQIALAQMLGLLDNTPAASLPLDLGLPSAQWLHLYTEAARLAFADRAQYVADPDFVHPPAGVWESLWEPGYLRSRARLIDTKRDGTSMGTAQAGAPGKEVLAYAPMPDQPESGTSHLSVMDRYGNMLAMTTSIEDAWGARMLVNRGVGLTGGFLLNNQLTDFSAQPTGADGKPVANRVQPGKRPRSTMSPTLVFDDSDKPLMALGSPGGPLIAHFVAKTLYARLHWQMPLQDAVNLPSFASLNGPTFLETGRFGKDTIDTLNRRGHRVQEYELPSGLHALERTSEGILGAADPRREGIVLGD